MRKALLSGFADFQNGFENHAHYNCFQKAFRAISTEKNTHEDFHF